MYYMYSIYNMYTMDKEKLKNIVESLQDVCRETKLDSVEDSMLFDCAVRIFNNSHIPRGENRAQQQKEQPKSTSWQQDALTEKQKAFLIKRGYKGDLNITKLEAKELIEGFLKVKEKKEEENPQDYF